jgi:hypothetical protein
MERRHKAFIGAAVAGAFAILLFLQIDAANNLNISVQDSKLITREDKHSLYDVSLELKNNRFMLLNAGEIKYTIKVNDEILGDGTIKPFYLGAYESQIVHSDFTADNKVREKYRGILSDSDVKLTATSNYKLYVLSFDVPFSHNPTPEQIDKFVSES